MSMAVAKIRPTPSIPQARERSEADGTKEPTIPKTPPISSPIDAVILVNLSSINSGFEFPHFDSNLRRKCHVGLQPFTYLEWYP